jgi:hypothetical protein
MNLHFLKFNSILSTLFLGLFIPFGSFICHYNGTVYHPQSDEELFVMVILLGTFLIQLFIRMTILMLPPQRMRILAGFLSLSLHFCGLLWIFIKMKPFLFLKARISGLLLLLLHLLFSLPTLDIFIYIQSIIVQLTSFPHLIEVFPV